MHILNLLLVVVLSLFYNVLKLVDLCGYVGCYLVEPIAHHGQ